MTQLQKNSKHLHKLQNRFREILGTPLVMIAGGAPRDLYFGHDYKDIDMFIGVTDTNMINEYISKLSENYGTFIKTTTSEEEYDNLQTSGLISVWNGTYKLNVPLQLVFWQVTLSIDFESFQWAVIDSFDFGINQISLGIDTDFGTTDLFETDKFAYTFTIHNVASPNHLIKIIDKFKRLTETKYKGYALAYETTCLKKPNEAIFGTQSVPEPFRSLREPQPLYRLRSNEISL